MASSYRTSNAAKVKVPVRVSNNVGDTDGVCEAKTKLNVVAIVGRRHD